MNKLVMEAHENAVAHGWWEEDRGFAEIIALMHSELSEALEEYGNGHDPQAIYYYAQKGKPEGIPIELADVVIRIFDACGRYEIDLDEAVRIKMEYNKTRPYKHGGKKI
jgi:NTP pyrophosphatase (non-canonical NTP hydrolase)